MCLYYTCIVYWYGCCSESCARALARGFPSGNPVSLCAVAGKDMEPALGVRVVRGPDWEWGDQDGGDGYVGTVAVLEEGGDQVIIQWDMGKRCRYRCGEDGKFDLRVLDSGQTG